MITPLEIIILSIFGLIALLYLIFSIIDLVRCKKGKKPIFFKKKKKSDYED